MGKTFYDWVNLIYLSKKRSRKPTTAAEKFICTILNYDHDDTIKYIEQFSFSKMSNRQFNKYKFPNNYFRKALDIFLSGYPSLSLNLMMRCQACTKHYYDVDELLIYIYILSDIMRILHCKGHLYNRVVPEYENIFAPDIDGMNASFDNIAFQSTEYLIQEYTNISKYHHGNTNRKLHIFGIKALAENMLNLIRSSKNNMEIGIFRDKPDLYVDVSKYHLTKRQHDIIYAIICKSEEDLITGNYHNAGLSHTRSYLSKSPSIRTPGENRTYTDLSIREVIGDMNKLFIADFNRRLIVNVRDVGYRFDNNPLLLNILPRNIYQNE